MYYPSLTRVDVGTVSSPWLPEPHNEPMIALVGRHQPSGVNGVYAPPLIRGQVPLDLALLETWR